MLLNSINQRITKPPLFVTLTYPASWPESPRTWKKHLDNFRRRLTRRFGQVPAVWRLEYQRRGAPHFHLLIFADLSWAELVEWTADAWYEVVGSGDRKHFMAGTRVEYLRSWRGGIGYAAKYMAKLEKLDAGAEAPGRFWGVWYKHLLEISFDEYPGVVVQDGYRMRRILARSAKIPLKRYANSPTFTAFVSDQLVIRLLRYYGYYRRP